MIPLSPGDGDSIVASPDKSDAVATPPPKRRRGGIGRGRGRGRGRVVSRSPRRSVLADDDYVPDGTPRTEEDGGRTPGMFSCVEDEEPNPIEIEVPVSLPARRLPASSRGNGGRASRPASGKEVAMSKKAKAVNCKRCGIPRDEADAPEDVEPIEDDDGFVDALIAEGSMHACKIRMGMNTPYWLCCDIRVPPSSFNAPELLQEGRSLLISVMNDARGSLSANIDNVDVDLGRGDSLVVEAGSEYFLRNNSATHNASLKLVLVTATDADAAI